MSLIQRIGMDGLDGDKLNHTSGCKGQHNLAVFSPMHGAYSPIWRAEATENPSLDDGPEIRAGMRNPKKEEPQFHPLWLEPCCCRKSGPLCGSQTRTVLIKNQDTGWRMSQGFSAILLIITDPLGMTPPA